MGRLLAALCLGWVLTGCGSDEEAFAAPPLDTGARDDALVSELTGAELATFCGAVVDYMQALQASAPVSLLCWTEAWANYMFGSPESCEQIVADCIARGAPVEPGNDCGGLEPQYCSIPVAQFERCAPVASYTTQLSGSLSSQLSCDNIASFQQILASGGAAATGPVLGPEAIECFGLPGTCLAQFFF